MNGLSSPSSLAPTADQLREHLMLRARLYAERRKMKLGTVSDLCAGDGKFLLDIEKGRNFTVDRYQRAMDWLEANMPAESGEAVA